MGKKEEIKKEDLVQAVVVADSFSTSFAPLTANQPVCLLPLAGRPLLEYTLQSLTYSGVQDVILYLTANSIKVKDWLKSSQWGENYGASPFSVTCITNEDCRSFGDAMRDLYEKGVLRNDFILCQGDMVSDVNLGPLLAKHKEIVAKDKRAIMTAVYTQGHSGHPLRGKGYELVLATDKGTNEILFYQRSKVKSTNFPVELFHHNEVEVMFDALDSNIYICSPIVLALFSDNFDIQDIDTMISEILGSELVDSTIYLQMVDAGFSCRASNPYLYGQIFEKVLNRWMYPLVPESKNVANLTSRICYQSNSVYRSTSATVTKGTVLGRDTFIGNSVDLRGECHVEQSALESAVVVGKNSKILGSIVMKNTKIGENCSLENCIVGENVEIPSNCVVKDKTILGHNVVLKPGVVLPPAIRLASEKNSDGFSDDEEIADTAEGEYGPKAFVHLDEEDEEEDDQEQDLEKEEWGEAFETSEEEEEGESGEESDDWGEEEDEEEETAHDGEHDDVKNFKREVHESLLRADTEGNIVTDNLVLEINSSKHAWNTTLSEVNQCVLESVITLNLDLNLPPVKLLAAVKSNITKFLGLLSKYSKSKSGPEYFLSAIPGIVLRHPCLADIISKVVHILYDGDVVGEDSIFLWWSELEDGLLKKKLKVFLNWLEEEDEEDEEDSD